VNAELALDCDKLADIDVLLSTLCVPVVVARIERSEIRAARSALRRKAAP
jgi:hypothetical protein